VLRRLADYGLFPEETVAILRERRVTTIRGNHKRWAIQPGSDASVWDLGPGTWRRSRSARSVQ
jgi:hypothetical protein